MRHLRRFSFQLNVLNITFEENSKLHLHTTLRIAQTHTHKNILIYDYFHNFVSLHLQRFSSVENR